MAKKSSTSSQHEKLHYVSNDSISLTDEIKRELEEVSKRPIDLTDPDAPEITDFNNMQVGKFYRPIKKQITLRVDADVLAWFKDKSDKYQTLMNQALREYALHH
jgi:uncharacterized protein (DUF4415 family)